MKVVRDCTICFAYLIPCWLKIIGRFRRPDYFISFNQVSKIKRSPKFKITSWKNIYRLIQTTFFSKEVYRCGNCTSYLVHNVCSYKVFFFSFKSPLTPALIVKYSWRLLVIPCLFMQYEKILCFNLCHIMLEAQCDTKRNQTKQYLSALKIHF